MERAPRGRVAATTETMMLVAQTKSRITKTKIPGGSSKSQNYSAAVVDGPSENPILVLLVEAELGSIAREVEGIIGNLLATIQDWRNGAD